MSRRPKPPDDVFFPVVPMLDMSFQMLAFFIMTFQAPTRETRIDLDLPAAPIALPRGPARATDAPDLIGLDTDLVVHASADAQGRLVGLRLNETPLSGTEALEDRLRRYRTIITGHPLRVTIAADDRLPYEEAARLIGACSRAGVTTIRLAPTTSATGPGPGP